jgi:aspartate/methionine/tyrosine aminotransferase
MGCLGRCTETKVASICSSAPSEFLSAVALKHSDAILKRNLRIIQDNLRLPEEFFNRYPGLFVFNRPMAGPVAFIKMNIDMPIGEFCDAMVAEKGVLLLPADVFSYEGQYFRMGFGRRSFPECLAKFEEYLVEKQYV